MRGTVAKTTRDRAAFTPEIDPVAVLDQIATETVVLEDGRVLRHPFEGPNREDSRRDRRSEKHRIPGHITKEGEHAVIDVVGQYENGRPIVVMRRGWSGFNMTKPRPWVTKELTRARSKIQKASRVKNRAR